MIKTIQSLNNEFIKYLNSLKNTSEIKKEGRFLIEGEHLIKEAGEFLDCVLTLKEIPDLKVDQFIVNESILKKLSNGKSPARIIGVVNIPKNEKEAGKHIVFLNNIQDPGNVGTIFRTSLAFDFFDVYCDKGCAYKYSPKVVQSSQGSIFKLNIKDSSLEELKKLKEAGFAIVSTTLSEKSVKLNDLEELPEKYVLVFGNEGQGVDKEILDLSDIHLKIEMGNIDSLNVAISAGIILHAFKNK